MDTIPLIDTPSHNETGSLMASYLVGKTIRRIKEKRCCPISNLATASRCLSAKPPTVWVVSLRGNPGACSISLGSPIALGNC